MRYTLFDRFFCRFTPLNASKLFPFFWERLEPFISNASNTRDEKITKHLNFSVGGQKIKQSSQIRYLGVILRDDLYWDTHLTNLEKENSGSIDEKLVEINVKN